MMLESVFDATCLKQKSLRAVAVVDEVVGGSTLDTSNGVLVGETLNAAGESSRGLLAFKSQEVGTKTSNMRRSHRGSGDGVLVAN